MFLITFLSLFPLAQADTFSLGVEGNIASNNIALLFAPEDLWFRGNTGGAIAFGWRSDSNTDGDSLAASVGWNHTGGLTLDGNWRATIPGQGAVSLVGDLIGLNIATGLLSDTAEIRIVAGIGVGAGIALAERLDLTLMGKLGLGVARQEPYGWHLTNTAAISAQVSSDF